MARNETRTTKKNFVAKSLNLVYFLQHVAAMFLKRAFYDCFIPSLV